MGTVSLLVRAGHWRPADSGFNGPPGLGERGRRSESERGPWWARRPTVGARVAQRAGPAPGKGTMARAHCLPVCPVWAPLMFQRFHREGTQ